jgi:hypothetical protein
MKRSVLRKADDATAITQGIRPGHDPHRLARVLKIFADDKPTPISAVAKRLLYRRFDRSERSHAARRQQLGSGDMRRADHVTFGDYLQAQAEDQNWLRREY